MFGILCLRIGIYLESRQKRMRPLRICYLNFGIFFTNQAL